MRVVICCAVAGLAFLVSDLPAVALAEAGRSADALAKADQTAPQPEKPQIFRAGVELVSLNVTVTDAQGRYITDLDQADFSVFEDGAKQELSFFNRTNLPIALSLLIDSSASMEQRMEHAQEAAIGFARRIRAQDMAQVVDFDSRVEIKLGFTNKIEELESAIRTTSAGGSTALHNAVYISLKGLKKIPVRQEDEIRRQAIILLSDGEDTSSLVTFEDVLDLARRSETAIYTIGLMEETAGGQSKGFREATYALRQLANDTGGRAFFPADMRSLSAVYGQIYDELSSQYTIGYTSKNSRRDGAWRRLVVRVARPNVQARTKQGYFAPVASAVR